MLSHQFDECLLWPFARNSAGYGHIGIKRRNYLVSRIACEARYGPPPEPKFEAAHSCNNGHLGCVNPRHLRWASRKENIADELIHGTRYRGPKHWIAKLTETDVREIRRLSTAGEMQREIASRYGITQSNVSAILRGKSWGWLHDPAHEMEAAE